MKVTIEPTPEILDAALVLTNLPETQAPYFPARVWKGTTDTGVAVDVYVFSIVPSGDVETFVAGLPDYMRPTRDVITKGPTE